jgi:6,7-dimethyl-8-ribityllumazine synthase
MLKRIKQTALHADGARFAIVASKYNASFVDGMLRAARAVLAKANAAETRVIRVPGAFEIPVVAATMAANGRYSAIICLGVVLRGETTHAQNISEAVSGALAQIQIEHRVPVIHEVLLLESEQQAMARCLASDHNRGAEAATTAVAMARIMSDLNKQKGPKAWTPGS